MFLLDTNVISEVRKGARCNAGVAAWFAGVPDADLFISVLVTGEIRRGVERVRPRDPRQAEALEHWLGDLIESYADRVLPVDARVAEAWGRLGAARPVPVIDALLAATAHVHDMTLVTRNASDVDGLAVAVLNPFEASLSVE